MHGYEVDVEGLRKATGAARDAGDLAGQIKLGDAVASLASAMPDAVSAGAAENLASVWSERLRGWSGDMTAFGGGLAASADE